MARSFRIRIEPRGIEVTSLPGQSILDSILAAGVVIKHSCDAGACYLCRSRLKQGLVNTRQARHEYLGSALSGAKSKTDNETGGTVDSKHPLADFLLTCLAYPITDCVLEIANVLAQGELPQITAACQVQAIKPLNHDVTQYFLKLPAGKAVNYYAGQYLEIILNEGTEGEGRFPFSIANALSDNRTLELHIRDIPDSDSLLKLKQALQLGEVIKVCLPSGTCTLQHIFGSEELKLDHTQTPLVFLAGSTGFAPIKAMLEDCLPKAGKRPIMLYWGGRTEQDLYLSEAPQAWQKQYQNFQYIPVISEPYNSPDWQGRTGLVHKVLMADLQPFAQDLTIVAGGSPGMVHAAYDDFIAAGLDPRQLHSDVFAYAPRS